MKKAGGEFSKKLSGGEVVCLFGELGSGKTTFAQGMARGFGVRGRLNSPTFNILKVYYLKKGANGKIRRLYHIDCYRLSRARELRDLGFEEWLGDKQGVVVVEWADKLEEILPKQRIEIRFRVVNERTREIRINFKDETKK